jgi:hypothetical protein
MAAEFLIPLVNNGVKFIPRTAPKVERSSPDVIIGTFIATVGPAAVLGALAGSHLATLTPRQKLFAQVGALAGVAIAGLALLAVTARQEEASS